MHKFECKECAAFCQLQIDCMDLEGVLPFQCPSHKKMKPNWTIKSVVDVEQNPSGRPQKT